MTKVTDLEASFEQYKVVQAVSQAELKETMEKNKVDADKQFAEILQLLKTRQPAAAATTIPPPLHTQPLQSYPTMPTLPSFTTYTSFSGLPFDSQGFPIPYGSNGEFFGPFQIGKRSSHNSRLPVSTEGMFQNFSDVSLVNPETQGCDDVPRGSSSVLVLMDSQQGTISELGRFKAANASSFSILAMFMEVNSDRDGKIIGDQARSLFLNWRLPREILKKVWDVSDQDNDSMLSLREFCIALYLMERYREGYNLPPTLPSNVLLLIQGEVMISGNVSWIISSTTSSKKGIHAFRNDRELPKGEEMSPHLYKAIEKSRFLTVIFSKNYASSSWCLRELVKILECKEIGKPKHEVQIIFYDVKPGVVRNQKRSYEEAFCRYKISNSTEVDKWKEALSMAANLSGWDLEDMTNGFESKFIDCISKDILKILCDGPLHVGENLVGIDFHFDKLNLSRFVGSDMEVAFVKMSKESQNVKV
ncbi:NB-ARC domains-containing protein [Tanacetum coccineum]